jgi:hypothetical protein
MLCEVGIAIAVVSNSQNPPSRMGELQIPYLIEQWVFGCLIFSRRAAREMRGDFRG